MNRCLVCEFCGSILGVILEIHGREEFGGHNAKADDAGQCSRQAGREHPGGDDALVAGRPMSLARTRPIHTPLPVCLSYPPSGINNKSSRLLLLNPSPGLHDWVREPWIAMALTDALIRSRKVGEVQPLTSTRLCAGGMGALCEAAAVVLSTEA